MRVRDYLVSKYQMDKPTTLTKVEAKAFGIPFPLESGWLAKYGDQEIFEDQLQKLVLKLSKRLEKQERRNAENGASITRRGLEAIKSFIPRSKSIDVIRGDFLSSFEWRRLRMIAIKRYGARCQCCGATPDHGARIHVDHIKPRKAFPHLALDIENLQILCEECNHGKGNWDMSDWRQ